jgi:ribosome biogenesis GTPase
MRELQLTDAASGLDALFADLHELSGQCRFRDCRHVTEPGCAVLAAVESGSIDRARLGRWQKLVEEGKLSAAGLAERR